ncbi:hypothetical protein [Kitasatospora sp. NPDC059327]|uniref:hypothetical protein n=1 Tax=Kitasatospora sp. NPDC059327 TaxID=3346803 RepID=UPI0036D1D42C
MSTYHPHRPAPEGATGSWRDARRAPAAEVEHAADRERDVFTHALLAMGGTLVPAVVTAWRPLDGGRWAAHVLWGPPLTAEWIISTPHTLRPAHPAAPPAPDAGRTR